MGLPSIHRGEKGGKVSRSRERGRVEFDFHEKCGLLRIKRRGVGERAKEKDA